MSKFRKFLLDESREIDNTIENLKSSIKNMEKLLKTLKGDKEQEKNILSIIKKQRELIKQIETDYG